MLVTLSGLSRMPPVCCWKITTISARATIIPYWRTLFRMNRRTLSSAVAPGGSGAVVVSLIESAPVHGHVAHQLFLGGVGAGDLSGQPPFGEGIDAVTHPEQLWQLGRDEDDGLAFGRQLVDDHVDLILGADVDAARRL